MEKDKQKVKIPRSKLPRRRFRWERKPFTHVKESGKKYSRQKTKSETRKVIKNEKERP